MIRRKIVLKRTTYFILLNFLGLTVSNWAHAVADFGNPGVLPVGRHQMTFRFGQVSEIQDKFNSQGTLQSPSRMNQRLDNKFLMSQKEFREFAKLLDEQLAPGKNLSKEMDMGAVEFKGNATVDYFAPQLARGITSIWSLGVAVPLVRYQADIRAENVGVNKAKGVLAVLPENMDQVTSQQKATMLKNMRAGGRETIMSKAKAQGYTGMTSTGFTERDEQFMGDVVLGSSLKLYDSKAVDFYLLHQLTLPTGPKDDPDDLIDLNIFGKTQLQTVFFTNFDVYRWLELGTGVSYTWGIPDDFEKRVPTSEADKMPAAVTRETVRKDPGDAIGAQFYSLVKFSDYIHVGAGYEVSRKQADSYTGSRGARYDLLEKDTESAYGIAKFKFTYSAVDGFIKGVEKIPYSVTYAFADHVYGKNVERELTHELLLKFYF